MTPSFRLFRAALVSLVVVLTACGGGETPTSDEASTVEERFQDNENSRGAVDGVADSSAESDATDNNEDGDPSEPEQTADMEQPASALDQQLDQLISQHGLTGDAARDRNLPGIDDPLPQLGMQLFFTKSLGGQLDSACASCHHPMLGGTDTLSLPVGVDAVNPDLLGPGRVHIEGLPPVPRNSPTVFNTGLWDNGLFNDSRVESLLLVAGSNGAASTIRTPDSLLGQADPNAGANLATAQARFPVTSVEEMRGETFEAGGTNDQVRDHLAARLGDYGIGQGELQTNGWLARFQQAFDRVDNANNLITYQNIALALSEYERSMVFVNNPWARYVAGDRAAISESAKRGASLFLRDAQQGGAGCVACHSGDRFTDEQHHVLATPQIGPGKGDGNTGTNDTGRGRETGNPQDNFRFRTPSLLNVAVTAPYMHAGSFANLDRVLRHYDNQQASVQQYFDQAQWCDMDQFGELANCQNLYPDGRQNTDQALNQLNANRRAGVSLLPNINLNNGDRTDLEAFLESLTDDCVLSRACMGQWVPDVNDTGPDGLQLNAVDRSGGLL